MKDFMGESVNEMQMEESDVPHLQKGTIIGRALNKAF